MDRLAGGPAAIAAAREGLAELDAGELVEAHRVGQAILREVQAFLLAVTAEGRGRRRTSRPPRRRWML
ncbi:hypothetical protein JL108_05415 [Aeromicrobium sp. YIM 150415]|uniref:hypothetical protein n=1 Tax=Aeromicrobium sp. YIM 150415 TaxID=2803912 RepID=UPI0019647DE0|nr:hypothetical protein [Aeromicrobium sp. YIM 150415]MBM9462880.1 hypothetical protein [Aeromicrobium sp. YIM 150415]